MAHNSPGNGGEAEKVFSGETQLTTARISCVLEKGFRLGSVSVSGSLKLLLTCIKSDNVSIWDLHNSLLGFLFFGPPSCPPLLWTPLPAVSLLGQRPRSTWTTCQFLLSSLRPNKLCFLPHHCSSQSPTHLGMFCLLLHISQAT